MKTINLILALCCVGALNATPPQPVQEVYMDEAGMHHVRWQTFVDRSYAIQISTDMVNWNYLPEIIAGDGEEACFCFETLGTDLFVRLNYADQTTIDPAVDDFDRDGVSNLAEVQSNQQPFYFNLPLQYRGSPGILNREIWTDMGASRSLDVVRSDHRFYDVPSASENITTVNFSEYGDRYAQTVRGYLIAPVTGEYRFWLTSNGDSSLSVGPDADKLKRREQIRLFARTPENDFGAQRGQASHPINLRAGEPYFFEIQHKAGDGIDHLSAAWSYVEENKLTNWALKSGVTATQSSFDENAAPASVAIDGDTNGALKSGDSISTTSEVQPWWQVNLGETRFIDRVEIFNRDDGISAEQNLSHYSIEIFDENDFVVASTTRHTSGTNTGATEFWETGGVLGKTVRVQLLGADPRMLFLAEVKILGRVDQNSGYQPLTVISANHFESYNGSPRDGDEDELDDQWELDHGFNPNMLESGEFSPSNDSDRDGFLVHQESSLDLIPGVPDSVPGYLTAERWKNVGPRFLERFYQTDQAFQAPESRLAQAATNYSILPSGTVVRLRGYIVPPETGEYCFWISSRDESELWLSTDQTKANKQRVAELTYADGNLIGVFSDEANIWDQYANQKSELIELVAGQRYYFEAIHLSKQSLKQHLSLAWARPGREREILPLSAVHSYGVEVNDLDDDMLLDQWENSVGLSSSDNGLTDREREGAKGDYDSDGISNLDEYRIGTDPTTFDNAGNGLTDMLAFSTLETISENEVDLVSEFEEGVTWSATESGNFLQDNFRGESVWSFSTNSNGYRIIELRLKLSGNLRSKEILPLRLSINGSEVFRPSVVLRENNPFTLRFATPYLYTGSHQIGLLVDNAVTRRSLELVELKVIEPGADTDGTAAPTVIENQLAERNQVEPFEIYSYVSPFFIEGIARSPQEVDLTSLSLQSVSQRRTQAEWDSVMTSLENQVDSYIENLDDSIETWASQDFTGQLDREGGEKEEVQAGAGNVAWFSDIDLTPNGATAFIANFENFGLTRSGIAVWTPYNALEGGEINLRAGSKLLLGAWTADGNGISTITFEGQDTNLSSTDSSVYEFVNSGTYQVSASHSSGASNVLTVNVRDADFGSVFYIHEQVEARPWELQNVDSESFIEVGDSILLRDQQVLPNGGVHLELTARSPGLFRVAARLSEKGPIMGIGNISASGISDAIRNDDDRSLDVTDGLGLLKSPLVISNMPPGGSVRVVIFRGGGMFQDGSTVAEFSADDIGPDGRIDFYILHPFGEPAGFCHYVQILDAEGNLLQQN